MPTKPCERGGCTNLIEDKAYRLTSRHYCSKSCAKIAGERRHRRTLAKAVKELSELIPSDWALRYSAADLARIKVLLGRAYLIGGFKEKQRADAARRYAKKTGRQEEAA